MNQEKHECTSRALNLICLDCGEIGADGFKHFPQVPGHWIQTNGSSELLERVRDLPPVLRVGGPAGPPLLVTSLQTVVIDVLLWKELLQQRSIRLARGTVPLQLPEPLCPVGAQVRTSACLNSSFNFFFFFFFTIV